MKVEQPANPAFTPILNVVNNNTACEVILTNFIESIENKPANTVLNCGLRITSDKPITAYYEIQSPYNAATYTLSGRNALGYEFIIPSQNHFSNYPWCNPPARNIFDIVATEDSTTILIIPKTALIGHQAYDTFSIVLNRGQTWSGCAAFGDSTSHLRGTFVFSDKPISISITDDAVFIHNTMTSAFDIVGDQLTPRHLAGNEFIVRDPIQFLPVNTRVFVYAYEDSTALTYYDSLTIQNKIISRGESAEFIFSNWNGLPYGNVAFIHSNKPVQVYEFNGVSGVYPSGPFSPQASACIIPPVSCVGSKKLSFTYTPPLGAQYSWQIYVITRNGNQANFTWNPNWISIPPSSFRPVPGTNGEWVSGQTVGFSNFPLYMTVVVSNSTGRFVLSAISSDNETTNTSFSKYSVFSDFSSLNLGTNRKICPGDSTLLDAGFGRNSYLWSTGDTTQTIWIKIPGIYWVNTSEADCNLSDTIVITFYSFTPINLGQNQTICEGDSLLLNAGTGRVWYQWSTGDTTQTIWVKNAGNFWVKAPDVHCIVSDTILVSTTPTPNITTSPLYDSICSGETTNIPLTSNPPGATFNWTATLTSGIITGFSADSGLIISQTLLNTGSTAGIVTYHLTPKTGSCTGNTVDFPVTVVVGDSVKASIAASLNTICAGTPVNFTATPTNGGTNPTYQWKVNSVNTGTNSPTFIYTPINGDVVQCILTSSNTVCTSNNPATSNTITIIVNPNLPVSVSVSPSLNPVCAGTLVTFSATPTYPGSTPVYQWKVNGINVGTNNLTYSYVPNNGDVVTCKLTSSETCTLGNPATSNPVTMIVNSLLNVSVNISASLNPFCIGSSVTFTATAANPGTTPVYQWKVNGINAGTNSPTFAYSPVSGDVVSCMLTSSVACPLVNPVTSNAIIMTGNLGLPAGVSITANPNPFCPGTSVTFTAIPSNGGTNPSYQWKVDGANAGTNSPTFTYNPTNNDSVRCVMTSNLSCVSNNPAGSNKIILSGTLAPVVAFTSCFDTITTLNAKPIKLKGGIPLNGTYSGPGVNSTTGIFTPSMAGIGLKTITYSYTNVSLCSASKNKTILVQSTPSFTCGNNLTDIRDNKVYPTVQIGSQCWMAANLNFGTVISSPQLQYDNCVSEKYCYNNLNSNCSSYGGLYRWDELMQYDGSPANQGLCPPGWHIPTEGEWTTLFNFYSGSAFAGKPLQDSIIAGFRALTGGVFYMSTSWNFASFATLFWSSNSWGATRALSHGMNTYNYSVSLYPSSRANSFPVRCLKD